MKSLVQVQLSQLLLHKGNDELRSSVSTKSTWSPISYCQTLCFKSCSWISPVFSSWFSFHVQLLSGLKPPNWRCRFTKRSTAPARRPRMVQVAKIRKNHSIHLSRLTSRIWNMLCVMNVEISQLFMMKVLFPIELILPWQDKFLIMSERDQFIFCDVNISQTITDWQICYSVF